MTSLSFSSHPISVSCPQIENVWDEIEKTRLKHLGESF